MKSTFARGVSGAVLAAGLLFAGAVAYADASQDQAECQAEATGAGVQDPAEVNQYIAECMQAKAGGDQTGSGDETTSDQEQAK